ncbi:MAG: YegS/Rv2252/BmrU family lipid kinase [Erysipelotrichaceae bacterium]|nr:YegS/Rv2252/BmrU family lipid kinase [Erysipelotrichaceae bacterium]
MNKTLLIINSITGNGRNKVNTFDLIDMLSTGNNSVTVFPISADSHLQLSEYLTAVEYDRVICVGGDGTLNRTINEIMSLDYKPVLGYIPAGTTNDFSKNLGLVTDIYKACNIIRDNNVINYDLGCFNNSYFSYVASFGSLSSVSYSTDQTFKNVVGYAAYILNGISLLPEMLSMKCHLKIDTGNEFFEGDYLFGAICNSLSIAGVRLSNLTLSDLTDGEFELLLVKCPDHIQDVTGLAVSLLNGDLNNPFIEYRKINGCRIYADSNTEWSLDGEYGGNPANIEFKVVHQAISIIAEKSISD